MTTLEILKGVRKLLNSPKRWIKHSLKEIGADGKPSYCIVGAIGQVVSGKDEYGYRELTDGEIDKIYKALNIRTDRSGWWMNVINFNNNPTLKYSGMRARLNRAIKRLEAKV